MSQQALITGTKRTAEQVNMGSGSIDGQSPLQRQVETWVGDCPIVDQHRIALMLLDGTVRLPVMKPADQVSLQSRLETWLLGLSIADQFKTALLFLDGTVKLPMTKQNEASLSLAPVSTEPAAKRSKLDDEPSAAETSAAITQASEKQAEESRPSTVTQPAQPAPDLKKEPSVKSTTTSQSYLIPPPADMSAYRARDMMRDISRRATSTAVSQSKAEVKVPSLVVPSLKKAVRYVRCPNDCFSLAFRHEPGMPLRCSKCGSDRR